ncbi:peptidoglycan DD-metalloendopeptidase family protein [Candidatus Gracilibacteria bacterium]|nr:peptidoglycan DD-metalloendopeptidase family protein [Candidatus Gracilibacteria bacterium]
MRFSLKHILLLGLFFPILTYAAIDSARIIQEFKEREQSMIFESDTLLTEEDREIMNNFRRLSIFNSLTEGVRERREILEEQAGRVTSRVQSLEESIEQLNTDIAELLAEVNRINGQIIETKEKVDTTRKQIGFLQQRVEKSSEVIREYIVYLYKKGNFVSSNNDIDNFKTILLSGERIDEVLNDLYFKSLIQITGQQLIERHNSLISDLYVSQIELEDFERELRLLRRNGIIEKNLLDQKRESREYILTVTRGQEALYQRYVEDALQREQGLRIRELRERVSINNTQRRLLERFNCEFVDIIADPTLLNSLSSECRDINKIIYAESRLSGINLRNNPLDWPIMPYAGISAYFKDSVYRARFGTDHDAIDIIAPQGTEIKAPADGYVIFIEPPRSTDYAYFAVKHSDELVTVYGHVNEIKVGLYDFVEKGQVIALSGGEFGTLGAGLLSTGPHLHFVVYENQEYRDPLEYLNISYLQYRELPEKYRFKFLSDFRTRQGYDFSEVSQDTDSGNRFRIVGSNEVERQKYLLNNYATPAFRDWNMWVESSLAGGIDPTFMMCVGLAESGLGRHLKSKNNIGNVGNNDRGDTRDFPTPRSAIVAMVSTFNNRFLGHYTEIQQLSRYGNKIGTIYASSDFNWHNNITRCMSHVKGEYIPDHYSFRTQ